MTSKEAITEQIKNGLGILNGTVLLYSENPTYDVPRMFAAIYSDGYWYTTREESSRISHAYFVDHLRSDTVTVVDIATQWEAVK